MFEIPEPVVLINSTVIWAASCLSYIVLGAANYLSCIVLGAANYLSCIVLGADQWCLALNTATGPRLYIFIWLEIIGYLKISDIKLNLLWKYIIFKHNIYIYKEDALQSNY